MFSPAKWGYRIGTFTDNRGMMMIKQAGRCDRRSIDEL